MCFVKPNLVSLSNFWVYTCIYYIYTVYIYMHAYNISFPQLYWIFVSISANEKKHIFPPKKRDCRSQKLSLGCVCHGWCGPAWCERVGAGAQTTKLKTFIWHGGFPQNGGETPTIHRVFPTKNGSRNGL